MLISASLREAFGESGLMIGAAIAELVDTHAAAVSVNEHDQQDHRRVDQWEPCFRSSRRAWADLPNRGCVDRRTLRRLHRTLVY